MFLFLLSGSCHQEQVTCHELNAKDVTGATSVQAHQLAGGAVSRGASAGGVADVPHPYRVVHGGRSHQAAVGTEGQACDGIRVAAQVFEQGPGGQVPELQPLVLASWRHIFPIRGEGQSQDGASVACEEAHRAALLGAPQSHGLVGRASRQIVWVGMKFDAVHISQVAGVESQRVCPAEGPEACGPVVGSAGEVEAARTDVYIPHWVGMTLIEHSVGEAAQIPIANGGVLWAGEETRAVRQEGGAIYGAAVASQDLHLAASTVLIVSLEGRETQRFWCSDRCVCAVYVSKIEMFFSPHKINIEMTKKGYIPPATTKVSD